MNAAASAAASRLNILSELHTAAVKLPESSPASRLFPLLQPSFPLGTGAEARSWLKGRGAVPGCCRATRGWLCLLCPRHSPFFLGWMGWQQPAVAPWHPPMRLVGETRCASRHPPRSLKSDSFPPLPGVADTYCSVCIGCSK